mmetsp:Transcript_24841/g.55209  ORF Transcript_24841/g.55209 Transcript_24841/m.55209 type:complete len:239 (-) Transcript_24841:75-791(-)
MADVGGGQNSAASSERKGCPFASSSSGDAMAARATAVAEVLNPRNMMPNLPQTPHESQQSPLSKDRVTSNIPKAEEVGNWVYPSPQQFYHALLRKNKEAEADAMEAVVHVHNVTNDRTWEKILDWEQLHAHRCPTPSLLRFVGRSTDLSWGAWWSKRFSYRGEPFDRHDWFVDRCGASVVRYVIDYYDDPKAKDEHMQITIDARPAFDSLGSTVDRLRRPLWQVKRVWAALFGGHMAP